MENHVIEFEYTNHRGVTEKRRVIPERLVWRATPHHPIQTWILEAHCLDRNAIRSFELTGMKFK